MYWPYHSPFLSLPATCPLSCLLHWSALHTIESTHWTTVHSESLTLFQWLPVATSGHQWQDAHGTGQPSSAATVPRGYSAHSPRSRSVMNCCCPSGSASNHRALRKRPWSMPGPGAGVMTLSYCWSTVFPSPYPCPSLINSYVDLLSPVVYFSWPQKQQIHL